VCRDNLDENGSGNRNVKRRPVATPMIFSRFAVRKRVFALVRCAADTTGPLARRRCRKMAFGAAGRSSDILPGIRTTAGFIIRFTHDVVKR
jgi:hypothetical protein